jgi:hypothetical protein
MTITKLSIDDRLSQKFFVDTNNCWHWIGTKNLQGYGTISVNGKNVMSRRLMYSLRKRPLESNEYLLSLCKNKLCINPEHHCTTLEAFDLNIIKGENINDCWEWSKGQNGMGYGAFNIKGKPFLVHRLMYERHNGKIPDGMHILHSCDNPICLNPKHLFIGSQKDNVHDMIQKNRDRKARGSKSGRAIINEEIALKIKTQALDGLSIINISKLNNLPYYIVYQVYNNITWRHVRASQKH